MTTKSTTVVCERTGRTIRDAVYQISRYSPDWEEGGEACRDYKEDVCMAAGSQPIDRRLALIHNATNKVAAALLSRAAEQFGNHGCNDWLWPDNLSQEERKALHAMVRAYMGDPDYPNEPDDTYGPMDHIMMAALAEYYQQGVI